MNPAQLLSALAAAIWAVWVWKDEHQQERDRKREQEAALFVNPLILCTQALQSRLYQILEGGELAHYREEHPHPPASGSKPALELVYLLSQYWGWGQAVHRYGPMTRSPQLMSLIHRLVETFESRAYPGEAFRLTLTERVALGQVGLRRVDGAGTLHPTFETVPFYQFQAEFQDPNSERAALYSGRPVQRMLEAIDRASCAEELEGRERLIALQNLMVDFLTFLEKMRGFHLGVRLRPKAAPLGAQRSLEAVPARILHVTGARVRLGIPLLESDRSYANRLCAALWAVPEVRDVRVNAAAGSAIIQYQASMPGDEFAHRLLALLPE